MAAEEASTGHVWGETNRKLFWSFASSAQFVARFGERNGVAE